MREVRVPSRKPGGFLVELDLGTDMKRFAFSSRSVHHPVQYHRAPQAHGRQSDRFLLRRQMARAKSGRPSLSATRRSALTAHSAARRSSPRDRKASASARQRARSGKAKNFA